MNNSFANSEVLAINHYSIVNYRSNVSHEGRKGELISTDLGLIFEPENKKNYYIYYSDITNIRKIERGDQIYQRLMFQLIPLLVFIATLYQIMGNKGMLTDILMLSLIPIAILGLYFRRYWNYIQFDYVIDYRHIAEVKFRFRFIDMVLFYSILRGQQIKLRSDNSNPFDTSFIN